jgi:hypothetical protein
MSLILKRASATRPSGEWNDDDYDVLAERNSPPVGPSRLTMPEPDGNLLRWSVGHDAP